MRSARFSIRSLTAPALHAGEEGAGTVTDSATFGHVVPDLEPVRQKAVGIFQLGAKFGCGLEAVGKQGDDLFLHFLRPCLIMLPDGHAINARSEEHTSELQSLMRISYAVFCLKKKLNNIYSLQHELIYCINYIIQNINT